MKKVSKELPNLYRSKTGTYMFRKAIPKQYRELAGKREFKISLKTGDFDLALEHFVGAKKAVDDLMRELSCGRPLREAIRFRDAALLAEAQGRKLKPLAELLQNPAELLAAHKEWKSSASASPEVFKTFFNADLDDIKLSELIEFYEREQTHELASLNSVDRKKKLAPFKLAVEDLIQHLKADKTVRELTNVDGRSYEIELKTRIADRSIKANTANKRFVALRVLIKTYFKANSVSNSNIATIFDGMKFKENPNKRAAFSVEFVRDNWLRGSPFDGLNTDAKYLLLAMLDTGCGLKELCGLDSKSDIRLQADIPHIVIRPNENRKLKTRFRERVIPLVGFALIAFQNCPEGFRRYTGPNGFTNASAAINKFLNENGLDENGQCTANGLRHLFKDRLREHGVASEIQDKLMGHQTPGMSTGYGKGFSMIALKAAMKEIEVDFSST